MGKIDTLDKVILLFGVFFLAFIFFQKLVESSKKEKLNKVTEVLKLNKTNAHGVVFGKKGAKYICSPEESEGHIGVFSATGTGRAAAIGIPTLRAWQGSVFVIDISGDIEKNCPNIKDKIIFNPDEIDKYKVKYSPFAVCDKLSSDFEKNEFLSQLAYILMPDPIKGGEASDFFIKQGRRILISALIAFYHQGLDFIEICEKIVRNNYINLFGDIDQSENLEAISFLNAFEGANEKNTAGCKQAVDEALTLFATNYTIKNSVGRGDITIEPEKIENNAIFIVVDDTKLELYSPLLNLITSQYMNYIANRKVDSSSKTILLFLDEYSSLRINSETILQALRKYRKRKARIMLLTQNLADLNVLYTPDITKAMMANFKFKVLLGGLNEPESQKYFAELIGFKDVLKRSTSKNARQHTITKSESQEYYIKPADLDKQGKDKLILIHGEGRRYMILNKNYYFKP